MDRSASIAELERVVGTLTDEQLETVADFAGSVVALSSFRFSDDEKAVIARSFDDFKHGRTLSLDEAETRTMAALAARRL